MTERLPTPGGDLDAWASLLNAYLRVEHAADGTHSFPGTPSTATFLRGDRTWAVPPATAVDLSAFGWENVRAHGATGDGTTDDTAAIQAADAAAFAAASGGTTRAVVFPAGRYVLTSNVTWKTSAWKADHPNSNVQLLWNGSAGGTMVSRASGAIGGNTHFLLQGICLSQGSAIPGTHLDLTGVGSGVDAIGCVERCTFQVCSGDSIKAGAALNLHWRDLRWDSPTGYALRITATGSEDGSSVVLDNCTYALNTGTGAGFVMIDNTANAPGVGFYRISGIRVECSGGTWGGNKALVTHKLPASTPASQGLHLAVQDAYILTGDAACKILHRETADTTGVDVIVLRNVKTSPAFTNLAGGGWSANWNKTGTGEDYYALYVLGAGGNPWGGAGVLDLRAPNSFANIVARVRRDGEAANRFQITNDAFLEWGGGTNPPDVNLFRQGTAGVRTNQKLLADGGLGVGNSAAATTPGSVVKKIQVFDETGASLGYIAVYSAIT